MDDYCYAKLATSCQRESERESTENKLKSGDEDVQQLIGRPEELPPQLVESFTLKQEIPQPPCIKKEEEELCITQEGECLLGPQEAGLTRFPLTVVFVKTEDDEEKPQVDNLLAPLSDSEAEDEVEEPLSIKTNSEDVQQLMGNPEEVSPQSGGSSTLKQETPQPPCIKKEEEELCITREGECLLGREEADYTKFPLTVVSVKTEDDEEKPQVDNLLAPLSDSEAEDEVEEPLSSDTDCEGEEKPQEDNLLAPLSESDSEDGFEEPLSGDPDWEGDIRTHTNNKRPECADQKRAPHHGERLIHMPSPATALNMQRVTQGTAVPPRLPPPPAPALNMWQTEEPGSRLAYRPTWRGGRMADNISCSAAEVQILSLLETIKHTQDQLMAKVNFLTSRLTSTPGPEVEMPANIQFPLDELKAVEAFEEFLKEPSNDPARQRVVL
ncbi:uncharacterized protein LOC133549561 isoform X3 [Nerophis ophidion]|uniref:uncharacterized protein LOC133549561 isoform X3 n=1 Tax=Nerophis ophidion TaxID=159077 RepID=UPI002ADF49EA|nr:uncharacterized protein LOC133549561 isoform X3 [Nerophis ophidion]